MLEYTPPEPVNWRRIIQEIALPHRRIAELIGCSQGNIATLSSRSQRGPMYDLGARIMALHTARAEQRKQEALTRARALLREAQQPYYRSCARAD